MRAFLPASFLSLSLSLTSLHPNAFRRSPPPPIAAYRGEIISYDAGVEYYCVRYEDGDEEEMDEREIGIHAPLAAILTAKTPTARRKKKGWKAAVVEQEAARRRRGGWKVAAVQQEVAEDHTPPPANDESDEDGSESQGRLLFTQPPDRSVEVGGLSDSDSEEGGPSGPTGTVRKPAKRKAPEHPQSPTRRTPKRMASDVAREGIKVAFDSSDDEDAYIAIPAPKSPAQHRALGVLAQNRSPAIRPQRSLGGNKRKKRKMWTEEEKEAVKKGVRFYGVGHWSQIKCMFPVELRSRTGTQIKDCFRTMLKHKEI